jgi:hypothetical protein
MRSNRADEAYRQETLDISREKLDIARTEAGYKSTERAIKTAERLEKYRTKKALKERISGMDLDPDKTAMADALIAAGSFNDLNKLLDRWSGADIERKREEAEAKWKPIERIREEARAKDKPLSQISEEAEAGRKSYEFRLTDEHGTVRVYKQIPGGETTLLEELPKTGKPTVGRTEFDKKRIRDLEQSIAEGQGAYNDLLVMARQFDDVPEAAGISGALIENFGGPAAQIPLGIGDWVRGKLGTVKVKEVRSEARALIGQTVKLIDKSGRYSDRDVQLAKETQGALDWKSGAPEVVGALKTLAGIMRRRQDIDIKRLREGRESVLPVPTITTQEERKNLESGEEYIAPDGTRRRKR